MHEQNVMNRNRSPTTGDYCQHDEPKVSYPAKDKNTDIKCPLCPWRFAKLDALEKHFESKHRGCRVYACRHCTKVFLMLDELIAHERSHSKRNSSPNFHLKGNSEHELHAEERKKFVCMVCKQHFLSISELRRHSVIHQDEESGLRCCHFCGQSFPSVAMLKAHINKYHMEMSERNSGVGGGSRRGYSDNHTFFPTLNEHQHYRNNRNESPMPIEHSPSRSSNASHDSNEQQPYEPVSYLTSSKKFVENSAYPQPHNGRNTSPNTQKGFTPYHRQQHRSTVIPNDHCNSIHVNPPVVDRSVSSPVVSAPDSSIISSVSPVSHPSHALRDASLECLKCGEQHLRLHESSNRSHKCPYCHRSFSMKGNLRRHIRIHTNEAPYECPICFQRFRRSDGLKGHIKRHEILGESAPTDLLPSQVS